MKSNPKPPMARVTFFCALGVLFFAGRCLNAQVGIDYILVLGAQLPDPWVTEYTLGNEQGETRLDAVISSFPYESVCPGSCLKDTFVQIPANGTVPSFGPVARFPLLFVVWSPDFGKTVLTRVRIYNSQSPTLSADLPVFRLSTILAQHPDRMIFLLRAETNRTNLLLANVSDPSHPGNEVTLRIEIFSANGQSVAARIATIAPLDQLYIVDIGKSLGIPNPASGQVRVTRIGGSGVFWGILPSVNGDGTISITQGQLP